MYKHTKWMTRFGAMVVMPSVTAIDQACEDLIPPPEDPHVELTPSQRLWFAAIVQAIRDLRSKRYRRRAKVWLLAPQETPLTFRWAITMLGFDADAFQDRIRRLIDNTKALREVDIRRTKP